MVEGGPLSGIFYTIQNHFGKDKINNSIDYIEYMINDEYGDYLMSNLSKKHERFKKIRDHYLKGFPDDDSEYIFTYIFAILHLNNLLDKFHEALKLFPEDFGLVEKPRYVTSPTYKIEEIINLKINNEPFLGDDPKDKFLSESLNRTQNLW